MLPCWPDTREIRKSKDRCGPCFWNLYSVGEMIISQLSHMYNVNVPLGSHYSRADVVKVG